MNGAETGCIPKCSVLTFKFSMARALKKNWLRGGGGALRRYLAYYLLCVLECCVV